MRLGVLIGACVVLGGCATTSSAAGGAASRLPTLDAVVAAARAQPWGSELKQIPATVIEVGDLADVPYLSFAGKDIELNVYGDPAHPAGIEIGSKSDSAEFRASIRTFLGGLLGEADRKALAAVPEGKKEDADGMGLEITPPNAVDGFGAWWVTATATAAVVNSKASVGEVGELAHVPAADFQDSPAFPEVGAHPNFFGYPRFRPTGKKVWVTSYFKQDGAYHRRK